MPCWSAKCPPFYTPLTQCPIDIVFARSQSYTNGIFREVPMRLRLLAVVLSAVAVDLFLIVPRLPAQDDIFVTPIPNAPFNAVIQVERSIVRPDGTVLNLKTTRA